MSKSFCWTLNNYTEEEIVKINIMADEKANYVVYGKELGEVCKTEHLQGYIEFIKKINFNTVRNMFFNRAHIELRKGPQEDAINYCKKGTQSKKEWGESKHKGPNFGLKAIVYEKGTKASTNQGKRTDIETCIDTAKIAGMRGVMKLKPSFQALKVAEKSLEYCEKPRGVKPEVFWITGASGTGKSTFAEELLKGGDLYVKDCDSKFWMNYDAHDCVIIDDFRDEWWSLTYMLSLINNKRKIVQTKGGSRQFVATRIIITSIFRPEECYTHEPSTQLCRRINKIYTLNNVPYHEKKDSCIQTMLSKCNDIVINTDVERMMAINGKNIIDLLDGKVDEIISCDAFEGTVEEVPLEEVVSNTRKITTYIEEGNIDYEEVGFIKSDNIRIVRKKKKVVAPAKSFRLTFMD